MTDLLSLSRSYVDPRYQLPSRPTVTKSLLPKRHENLKDVVKCELMRVKHAVLTIDLWTSNQGNFKLSHPQQPLLYIEELGL